MTDVELASDLRIPVAEVRRLDHEIHPRDAALCKLTAIHIEKRDTGTQSRTGRRRMTPNRRARWTRWRGFHVVPGAQETDRGAVRGGRPSASACAGLAF